jgi:protein SCO1
MQENNASTLLLIVSAVIALSAGVWFGFDSSKPVGAPQIQGIVLPSAKIINDFDLVDHKNNVFSLNNLKNKWSLLFVGYTHCPDVCPTTLNTVKQVGDLMKEQDLSPPQMVFISIDPQRDTPARLNEYVSYFDKDFVGVTGELKNLEALASNLSVFFKKAAGASGDINADDYLMDHSASLVLVNPDGTITSYLSAPHTPMKMIDSIVRSQEYYKKIN